MSGLEGHSQARESPAFPRIARVLVLVLLVDLVLMGLWVSPRLLGADWSASSALLFVSAALLVLWMGIWILRSRTRLEDDVLIQTWLWDKRIRVVEVASLKLVYIPWLQRWIAPRLLVRRRGGGVTWFNSADPQILLEFVAKVAQRDLTSTSPKP